MMIDDDLQVLEITFLSFTSDDSSGVLILIFLFGVVACGLRSLLVSPGLACGAQTE